LSAGSLYAALNANAFYAMAAVCAVAGIVGVLAKHAAARG